VSAYQLLPLFIVAHEKGRHELACPPSVDVSRGHRGPGPEELGYVLEAEVLLMYSCPSSLGNRLTAVPNTKLFLDFYHTMDLSWDLGKNLMAP
jgi:hypothetical protein